MDDPHTQDLQDVLREGCIITFSQESDYIHAEIKTKNGATFTSKDRGLYYAVEHVLHIYWRRIESAPE